MFAKFSSRRQDVSPNQLDCLEETVRRRVTYLDRQSVNWQATGDRNADLDANVLTWLSLADGVDIIIGDFPHSALEALHAINLPVPVYVRVYALGSGFVRDTEFQRWARLNPPVKCLVS